MSNDFNFDLDFKMSVITIFNIECFIIEENDHYMQNPRLGAVSSLPPYIICRGAQHGAPTARYNARIKARSGSETTMFSLAHN